jgi:protein SCO1/2
VRRHNRLVRRMTVVLLIVWSGLIGTVRADQYTHAAHEELPSGAFSDMSLYQLASTWTTSTGQQISLGALHGQVQVLAMIYTTCDSACPLIVSVMQQIAASLSAELRPQVGFVLVTFDPERDTPEVLRAYSDKMHLDLQHWSLLHGHPDDVLALAVLLGVKYRQEHTGGFVHSNLITILNKQGEIVHRHEGLSPRRLSEN